MSADTGAILVRLSDVVGADRDKPAIGDFELAMQFNEALRLPAILGTIATAAENEDHRILSLQLGELPTRRRVVGKFVVGEKGPRDNVRSHVKSPQFGV